MAQALVSPDIRMVQIPAGVIALRDDRISRTWFAIDDLGFRVARSLACVQHGFAGPG